MDMTEYEIASLAAQVLSNFLTAFTVFLSIVSAYVIAAFKAGKHFTAIQLCIINACFLAAVGIVGFIVESVYRRFHALAKSIQVERGWIATFDFSIPLAILLVMLVLGCFIFMWNARNTEDE
jgi:hypothetical protein